jgi:folate-dependent tRNA-U54 methylase TrmFO/GidA
MLAETAYQVIQALNEKEQSRLYAMLGVQSALSNKPSTSIKKRPLLSDADATEYLLKKLKKIS